MRSIKPVYFATIVFVIGCLPLRFATNAVAEITAGQVRDSIRRGTDFLRSKQQVRGHWDDYAGQPGGVTALCALAMISAGVEPDDRSLQAALGSLRNLGNPNSTYSTSLQTMAFCASEPDLDRLSIRQNVAWLESAQTADGGWGYQQNAGGADESNTQFAMLALHEAETVGVSVDRATWRSAAAYWEKIQKQDGSWGYRGQPASGSMTCAGIASLMIAAKHLDRGNSWVVEGNVICCGKKTLHPNIDRGLAWLGHNFSVVRNPSAQAAMQNRYVLYYLYALERVGRIGGTRFIGEHDWYREGAEAIVTRQDKLQGSWSEFGAIGRADVSTALAVLFLSKGRRPVVVSKLRYSDQAQWNRHEHDLANLTSYVESRWKQDLTWQVIDINVAGVEDLLQTPVLFISGKDGLRLNAAAKQRLREYVDQGGFIFAEACCNSSAFDAQFRALMKEIFPDNPLRLLPPDHPVWFAEQQIDAENLRPLYGIDSCCRTSVVYCPENLGCYWELARDRTFTYPRNVQADVDAVLGIGANVLAYATGRELRDKLDLPSLTLAEAEETTFERDTLQIGKLQHSGGSDDAPAALTNLLRVVHEQLELPVRFERQLVNAVDKSLPDFPMLFIHGRRDFRFSEDERTALKAYLTNGGVIFGDAICASAPFAEAFRREMELVLTGEKFQRIPPKHAMFTKKFHGYALPTLKLRTPGSRRPDQPLSADVTKVPPILEGLQYEDRYAVIFSPNDISCAGESFVDGMQGL